MFSGVVANILSFFSIALSLSIGIAGPVWCLLAVCGREGKGQRCVDALLRCGKRGHSVRVCNQGTVRRCRGRQLSAEERVTHKDKERCNSKYRIEI